MAKESGFRKSLMTRKWVFDLYAVISAFVNLSGICENAVVVYLDHLDQL